MSIDVQEKQYICPGETHPISRSVHLARLAAYYPACRSCPFRTETGSLPKHTVKRVEKTERRVRRQSLFCTEGVRGVYLNELARPLAGTLACALAGLLWAESPLCGRIEMVRRPQGLRRNLPAVVVGHDERPSSPDLVVGVADALKRMGCQVIDVSVTTKPCFWFAVDHLQAAAGIYVTGSGCEPSWTGLDFVMRQAEPMSLGTGLERIEERLGRPVSRATRRSGDHRAFQAIVPYEAGLWKHFHALRPLKVVYGCSAHLVGRTLERTFDQLPCRLTATDIPARARDLSNPNDADVQRLGRAVRDSDADLGVLIDDDGMGSAFFDEEGYLIPSREITRLLIDLVLAESPRSAVVLEHPASEALHPVVEQAGSACIDGGHSLGELSRAMRAESAVFCGGDTGKFWFAQTFPTCDAILTLSKVLALLSQSDALFSEVVAPQQKTA